MEKLNPKAFFVPVFLFVLISCSGSVETLKTTPSHTLESGYASYLSPYNTNVTIEYFTGKQWLSQNFEKVSYSFDSIKIFFAKTGTISIPMNSVHQIIANKSDGGSRFWSGYRIGLFSFLVGGGILGAVQDEGYIKVINILVGTIYFGLVGAIVGGPIFGLINSSSDDGVFTVNEKADVEKFYKTKQMEHTQ